MMMLPRFRMLVLLLTLQTAHAYVTSYSAVPTRRQMEFLKEMTTSLCQSKVGCLSQNQLKQAPDLMYAWSHAQVRNQECALAVESLVKRLIDERRAGNKQADLTVDDYNCLLEGWARSKAGEAAAERCEAILTQMQTQGPKPNLTSFKAVLMAWRQAGVPYQAHRTQRLLEWMIRLAATGENEMALPDADCFDITLQTWSRSGDAQAPKQTEHILGVMERLYETTGLLSVKPRTTSFNAVLAAWSKSSEPDAADRATDILSFMERLAKDDETVIPDAASYCTVMGALAHRSDTALAARQADALLRHVEQAMDTPLQVLPDKILFNTAMGLWAKVKNESQAYRKARSILDRQIALYDKGVEDCRPDVYGFTSVIASCAAEPGPKTERTKAFHVALATYQQLRHLEDPDAGPNHVSYGAMLKACAKLLPASSPLRRKWVRRVFTEACEAGCVGDMVVSRLREAAAPDVYRELMQGHRKNDLPSEWTANVNETNDYRRKKSQGNRQPRKKNRKRAEV